MDVFERNNKVLWAVSDYLNYAPRAISADMIREIDPDGVLEEEQAFGVLMAGLSEIEDDSLIADYFLGMVRRCDPEEYRSNPYYRNISFPNVSDGGILLTSDHYEPYEAFPCGDILVLPDGREIPQLGYFSERFDFPVILQEGREWMALKPNEVETMREAIACMHGKVAVFGLGLGYFTYMAALKQDVRELVVIEREQEIIDIFERFLLPQFPGDAAAKIRIVRADAFDFIAGQMAACNFDSAFIDLWHDGSDGVALYKRLKALELPGILYRYWIEDTLLSAIRFEQHSI